MKVLIDQKTGNGRVVEIRDGVLHSTGFVAGDDDYAAALGITKDVKNVWTKKMRDDFIAQKGEKAARSDAALIASAAAKTAEEKKLSDAVTAEVTKQLAAQ